MSLNILKILNDIFNSQFLKNIFKKKRQIGSATQTQSFKIGLQNDLNEFNFFFNFIESI